MKPGTAFQPVGEGWHLKVSVTFPDRDGKILILGFTDAESAPETVCVFEVGDHEFFTKRTAVNYRRAMAVVASRCNAGKIKIHDSFSPLQIKRIIEGAHQSEDLEPIYLRMLPSLGAELDSLISAIT